VGPSPLPPRSLAPWIDPTRWRQVSRLAQSAELAPVTTSMGRLFDAVSALCGIRARVTYEGQAALELEAAADRFERGSYPMQLADGCFDARETIRAVLHDLEDDIPIEVISARFHEGLARATAAACVTAAEQSATDTVVLSGGVFQNRVLLERSGALLADAGLRVLVPERLPPNDGGISFGQVAVTAARLARDGG